MRLKINWDAFGIATSVACAIHCAVLPLLLTSLPVFGVEIIHNVSFEYFMILLAAVVGSAALYHGYRKHHRKAGPLLIFSLGIFLLLLKQYLHDWQLWFLVPAVVAIVWAHFRNYQLCRKANHCHAADCSH
ncbi:MerC domain-containing protein [Flavihumibacter petaseus]|uniref:MerC domain-containing protein n=1 Tax=Flavihumibacter petaseus TaxID=549295 RepID=UPI00061D2583|nr:MerC domain-containing protein [Flavihumibacter petaseus]